MSSTREKIIAVATPVIGLGTCIAATMGEKILEGGPFAGIATVAGGVAVNLFSNTAQNLFDKLSQNLVTKHPDQLNHDIQKALVKTSHHALKNLLILYKEEHPSKKDIRQASDFIRSIREEISQMYARPGSLTGYDQHVQQFIHAPVEEAKQQIELSLHTALKNADIPSSFIQLFEDSFVDQLKLCFTQQLKANSDAWVAFQKTMLEGLKGDLTQVLDGQERIEKKLDDLSAKSSYQKTPRFSAKQAKVAEQLLKEINQPARIQVALDKALEKCLSEIKMELAEVKHLVIDVKGDTGYIKTDVKKLRKEVKIGAILVAGILLTTVVLIYRYYINKPFTLTVHVHGKTGSGDLVLRKQGYVVMDIVNGQRKKAEINEDGSAFFPGVYAGEKVKLDIDFSEPYKSVFVDSVFTITREANIFLPVVLQGIDRVKGFVQYADEPLSGVFVQIDDLSDTTDHAGRYEIAIPETLQRKRYDVRFMKEGFKLQTFPAYPQTGQDLNIVMEK